MHRNRSLHVVYGGMCDFVDLWFYKIVKSSELCVIACYSTLWRGLRIKKEIINYHNMIVMTSNVMKIQ